MSPRRFVLLLVLFAFAPQLHAQIKVDLNIKRRLFIAYEPIIATVAITNLTGHDVLLDNLDAEKWFSFQIITGDERLIPPRSQDYELTPLVVPAGQTLKRTVNLNTLYPLNDFGLYRIHASIFLAETRKYFSSVPSNIEITEGKIIWQQTIGVPAGSDGAGGNRIVSLLTFRQPKDNMLYVRVEDKDAGILYATTAVGRLLTGNEPQVELDEHNQLHLLQVIGPKTYLYSHIGLNGEFFSQSNYSEMQNRPHLAKLADGSVQVKGGQMDMPVAQSNPAKSGPKLSDRPDNIPLN